MPIQLAVFDLAGTTVNDEDGVGRCLRGALSAAGVEADRREVKAVMGIPKPVALRRLLEGAGRADLLPRLEAIHQDFAARMVRFCREDPSVYEIPGVSELFESLHRSGIRVAVNTGFGREVTREVLGRMRWEERGLLDAAVSSDEVARGRPHADMIHHLMRKLGVRSPHDVAKVGDTPADLEEGANAGCGILVGVTWGTHRRGELDPHPHTHLVSRIDELAHILEKARDEN